MSIFTVCYGTSQPADGRTLSEISVPIHEALQQRPPDRTSTHRSSVVLEQCEGAAIKEKKKGAALEGAVINLHQNVCTFNLFDGVNVKGLLHVCLRNTSFVS